MSQKHYLINRRTGQRYPINGCIDSNDPVDAIPMDQLIANEPKEVPRAVDLRPYMSPVEAQLTSSSWYETSFLLMLSIEVLFFYI